MLRGGLEGIDAPMTVVFLWFLARSPSKIGTLWFVEDEILLGMSKTHHAVFKNFTIEKLRKLRV